MIDRARNGCLWLLFVGAFALYCARGAAAPLAKENVPDPLKTWVPWVLHGAEDGPCPYLYNSSELRRCSWPARLTLNVTNQGATFSQQVLAFHPLWMPLPGDQKHWPQDVRVDGKPAAVVAQGNRPGIRIAAGPHSITGGFLWSDLPESLPVPETIGLVALTSNGVPIGAPNLDQQGQLWLKQRSQAGAGTERIEIRTSRLVTDDIPLTLSTHIDLTASGKSQEVLVPNVLLAGFIPLSLSSALPARFEADGKLRVQVRPGRWQIVASGRNMTVQTRIELPKTSEKLAANEEVWAFESRPELRLVTVEGVGSVDPQQTTLPQEWKRFPAFLLKPGDAMRLNQTRRGDPDPAPGRLALARNIWLDFDGKGYTVQDQISGSITRAWRLEMAQPQTLGRVAVDGADQYITQLDASAAPGIELRRGAASIVADSRIDTSTRALSATGWLQDFNQLSATLHLPPGWRLLHASGVDRAPQAWIEQWTLLDFFLVLIVTLATGKLFGWRWGVVALIALILSYQESGAPTWAWLNLLAALALLRVLGAGRLRKWVSAYRWVALLAMVAVLVPFAVDQVRQALYPVLERPWQSIGEQVAVGFATGGRDDAQVQRAPAAPPAAAPVPAPAEEAALEDDARAKNEEKAFDQTARIRQGAMAKSKSEALGTRASESYTSLDSAKQARLDQIDPNAKVQTGPGLPQWSWNDYALTWSGPVEHGQSIRLWLVSPAAGKLLTLARLALLLALLVRLAVTGPGLLPRFGRVPGSIIVAVSIAAICDPQSGAAWAQSTPAPEILKDLREKLLAPPDCLPHCAEIPRLKLSTAAGALQLRLEVHADADTAIPLPGGAQQWLPERVSVDGAPARGLLRDQTGNLWVQLAKGVHQVTLESSLLGRQSVQLALPLKPHRVEASLSDWTLDGLGESGEVGESLLLTRVAGKGRSAQSGTGDSLPPFVRVERTLNLGLVWQAVTRVVRAGPSTAPVLIKVPLLEGESVTQSEVRMQNGVALVNLGPQSSEFSFESALKERARLDLKASGESNQIDTWRLNLGPQWHIELSGIPVVHHQDRAGRWLPEWRPWPGEQVTLALTKPLGVAGQTLTLDHSLLTLSPGIRATDAELLLSLRSSRGGQHLVHVPEGAILQSVAIDGQTQPIRLEGSTLNLPMSPGKQEVKIAWREPRGISARFVSSQVDAGSPGVNGALHLKMPEGRWLLLTGGPSMGPAILFWGAVIVLAVVAVGLGRIRLTPLKWHHWFLLALGLTQAPFATAAIVGGWFLVLGARQRFGESYAASRWFQLGQIVLVLWTLAAMVSLFFAVQNGLLGYPEMQVAGNSSDLWNLHWYQDRTQPALPTAWVVSVPLLVYRLLMLAWALWLAYSLLKWLRWAWECYGDHGYWRSLVLWRKRGGDASGSA